MRQQQRDLQQIFGGQLHPRVHLTAQRFELEHQQDLPRFARHMRARLDGASPTTLIASGLIERYHPFWESRLLRWEIQLTEELKRLLETIEDILTSSGIRPHYPSSTGWKPTQVTALEDIPEARPTDPTGAVHFPRPLFTVRKVALSRIETGRTFTILEVAELSNPHPHRQDVAAA